MTPRSDTTPRISSSTAVVLVRAGACPHEIRPGTTVCLHCRKEERLAAAARRRRSAARIGLAVVGVAVCGAIFASVQGGAIDLSALRPKGAPRLAKHRASPSSTGGDAAAATSSPSSTASGATATPVYGATDAAPVAPAGTPAYAPTSSSGNAAAVAGRVAPAAAAPIVAEGRNVLRTPAIAPAVAVRAGDLVTVQFDTPDTRTRRADKFESIVRQTLPEVYGAAADSALAHVPAGTLVMASELVTDLPARGLRLPLPAGSGAITVWPETRPGRDGPLVVSYRTSVGP